MGAAETPKAISLNSVQSSCEHSKLVVHFPSSPSTHQESHNSVHMAHYSDQSGRGRSEGRLSVLRVHWAVSQPARDVNIRVCDPATFQVVLRGTVSSPTGSACVLGNVGYARAFSELHEGAIYMHQGKKYLTTHLCFTSLSATVTPTRVPYYTEAHSHLQIDLVRKLHACDGDVCGFGMVRVTSGVTGYSRVYGGGRTEFGGKCSLPQMVSEEVLRFARCFARTQHPSI